MRKETKVVVIILVVFGLGLIYIADEVSSLQDRVDEVDYLIVESGVTVDNGDSVQTYTVNLTRGASALEAVQRVADVDTKSFPGMGRYVTGINGLCENHAESKYWMVYGLSDENQRWVSFDVGVSNYELKAGDNIKFSYEKVSY